MSLNDQSDADHIANISQISNRSILSSLGDDELLNLINRLSQTNRKPEEDFNEDTINEDPIGDILPESSPRVEVPLKQTPTDTSQSEELSIPLAQPQPSLSEDEDYEEGEQENQNQAEIHEEIGAADSERFVFGDYASYFDNKSREQQKQDEDYINWEKQRLQIQGRSSIVSDIFKNCIVYVNGHTNPGISTLHKMIILNGGKFIHHLGAKGNATHIIATRITPKKQLEFKNYKIVRPEWVVDSVEKCALQNWADYSIINVEYGQKRLTFAKDVQVQEAEKIDIDAELEDNSEDEVEYQDEEQDHFEDDNQDKLSQLTQNKEKESVNDTVDIAIDSKHPNFLKIFFARSRLHHLSTWKADLRYEFLQLALQNSKPSKKTTNQASTRLILHIDFDCFFATASALKFPNIDFNNKPVCVSHGGTSSSSTADVASCNYVCRKYGVRNGMWVARAKKLCPDLICLDYDFESYERISKMFYKILVDLNADSLFPVSVDEALLDITSLIKGDDIVQEVEKFCKNLRNRVFEQTKCSASIGVSYNVLLAKLSLKKAKPNGQFFLHEGIDEFLNDVNVRDLPGAGTSIEIKLIERFDPDDGIVKVKDLKTLDIIGLEKILGVKTARKLYDYARGIDKTSIDISKNPQEFLRKSVSIDVNWGIRFENIDQVDTFLFELAKELSKKLNKIEMMTSQLVLKILKRAKDAPIDPPKYLGCGKCDSFFKSSRLGLPTTDYRLLGTEARAMFRHIGCDPYELRGISLSAPKLVNKADIGNQQRLPFAKVKFNEGFNKPLKDNDKKEAEVKTDSKQNTPVASTQFQVPSDIDSSVLEELPSTLKKKITEQREKNETHPTDIPKEIDSEVFNSLPLSIQEELKGELRRRNISITPSTPTKNKTYLQQLFPVNGGKQLEFARIKSPKKKTTTSPSKKNQFFKKSPTKSPVKIEKPDEQVLNELPSSIRDKIIEEWKTYEIANQTEASKIREKYQLETDANGEDGQKGFVTMDDFHQLHQTQKFQKRSRPNEIIKLIESWILHTKHKGPHIKDFELFDKYMNSIHENNKTQYMLVIEAIEFLLKTEDDICDKWKDIYQDIKTKR